MKRIISVFLSLCLICQLITLNLFVSAEDTVSFSLNAEKKENTVTVTVSLSGEVTNAGGLYFSLSFDEEAFSYVAGSRVLLLEAISSSDVNRDAATGGIVPFAADSSSAFNVSGDIVSYQFTPLSTDVGDKEFVLTINEFYYLDGNLSSVVITEKTVSTALALTDTAVIDVENKISAIGTVSLESETAITEARGAYTALTVQQKRQVSNFSVLTEAETLLKKLKEEALQTKDENAANEFREKHSKILSETVKTVEISDKEALETALKEYETLDVNVRIHLNSDKNLLNKLNTRIKELEKIRDDELAEQKLIKEAQEMAEAFKKQWKSFIELSTDSATSDHLTGIIQAIGNADSNALFNSYFMDYVEKEYAHLLALKEVAENYSEDTNSAETQAAKFLSGYGYLLNMTAENVTRDEEIDVRTAIAYYELLSAEAKEAVGGDTLSKLEELLSAIEALPEENNETVITDTQIVYKEKTVEAAAESETALVNVITKGMSPIVWWLLITLLITVVLCGVAAGLLIYLNKKQRNILILDGEEETE